MGKDRRQSKEDDWENRGEKISGGGEEGRVEDKKVRKERHNETEIE